MKLIVRHCLLLSVIVFVIFCYEVFNLSQLSRRVGCLLPRRSGQCGNKNTNHLRRPSSVRRFVSIDEAAISHRAVRTVRLDKYPRQTFANLIPGLQRGPERIHGLDIITKNAQASRPSKTATRMRRFQSQTTLAIDRRHRRNNLVNPTPTSDKRILVYTTLFGKSPKEILGPNIFKNCQVSACSLGEDRDTILQSDAVVFHGRDMPLRMPTERYWAHRWIYLNRENPHYTWPPAKGYNGVFNWTMTYKRSSDIWVPYGFFSSLGSQEKASFVTGRDISAGKSRLVAWATSHCESVGFLRERYVEQLALKIQIDVFGRCKPNQPPCARGSEECERRLKTYKFYLAFENALCEDYVTEKFWEQAVRHEMVPVVMGGADYKRLAPPHSYIDILDFPSVDSLARYLRVLDRNSSAYNEYFDWRTRYKVTPGMRTGWCQLCKMLHDDSLPRKVYKDLGKFWSVGEDCLRHAKTVLNRV